MSSKVKSEERKYNVILAVETWQWVLKTSWRLGPFASSCQLLTEIIEVCIHAFRPGDGAHESGFQKGGPLIGQAPQPTHIILQHKHTL